MIGTDTRLIFNEKHDLSVKRQLSKRVLRVAELMILLGGGPASYLECGGNALPPEAVSSYLALCSLLDSDEIFFPDRIQTHVLRGVLSEYVAGMDRGGIGTLTRFDNHKEVYAAVRAGLKSLASGRWDPPFIYLLAYDYAGCDRPAVQFVMRSLEDMRCTDYLLLGGKMPDIQFPFIPAMARDA